MSKDETTNTFFARAKKMLHGIKTIDFSDAQLTVRQEDQTRELLVKTTQDDSHPLHVLELTQRKDGYIKLNSYQYSKSVAPKSTKPGALRYIVPVEKEKGARAEVRAALEKLASDKNRRRRLKIASVEVVKETPMDMEWVILMS